MAIVDLKQISKAQPMREGEISAVDTVNAMLASFPLQTADIGDLAITTPKLAANAVTAEKLADDSVDTAAIQDASVTTEKLETALKQSISSIPDMEFGTSNEFDVAAGKYIDFGITFAATKAKVPVIFCEIQHSTGSDSDRLLDITISTVANDHFSVRVYNKTAIDITNAALGWMAITGR